jgi:phosphotransferase system IIB component
MDNHTCIQKDNITNIKEEQKRLRADLKYEARKHEDLQKTINGKLDKICSAIREGDDRNIKYIFLVMGMFLGAIIGILGVFTAFIK